MASLVLKWQIQSVAIASRNPKSPSKTIINAKQLPQALSAAAQRIELSINAVAMVGAPGVLRRSAFAFDTGVAVRSGGQSSLNVTSGYNWQRFLIDPGIKHESQLCRDNTPAYLSKKESQDIMRGGGVNLSSLQVCEDRSRAYVGDLETAIDKHCETLNDKNKPSYCAPEAAKAKQDTDSELNRLEAAFERLNKPLNVNRQAESAPVPGSIDSAFATVEASRQRAAQAQLDREAVERRRQGAQRYCEATKERQDQCIKGTCGPKPSEDVCTRYEEVDTCANARGLCMGVIKRCVGRGTNPDLPKWEQCQLNLNSTSCLGNDKRIESIQECVMQHLAIQN